MSGFSVRVSCSSGKSHDAKGWKLLGPGAGGGTFIPTISPHDTNMVLMTCDMTGGYITYDGGRSWRQFNIKTRIDSIAFDPRDLDVIYAGSSGLFRSEDKGHKWRLIFPHPSKVIKETFRGDEADHCFISEDNWCGGKIQFIHIEPDHPERIYIGVISDGLKVFFSTDRGDSWKGPYDVDGKRFHCIYSDPSSPIEKRGIFIFTDTAVYKASAKDFSIEKLPLPPEIDIIKSADCGMHPVAKKPYFFLITSSRWERGKFHTGVMRSEDLGQTWTELYNGLDDGMPPPDFGQQRLFSKLSVPKTDCRTVYIGVDRMPEIFLNPDITISNDYTKFPEVTKTVLANPKLPMTYKGIMKSEDAGDTWKWSLKLSDKLPDNFTPGWMARTYNTDWLINTLNMGTCPNNPDICWYTSPFIPIKTEDGGKTWAQVYCRENPDGSSSSINLEVTTCYGVHFDPFDKDHLVISYTDIGMQDSRDGGKSWKHAINGVPGLWENTCYWMVFDPEVKDRAWSVWSYSHDLPRAKMYRGPWLEKSSGGVCRTDDGVRTWEVSNNGMTTDCPSTHIVLDPRSPAGNRTLYVTTYNKGVFKSTDDGKTWTLKNKGLGKNLFAWRLIMLPDGTLYVLMARGARDGKVIDGEIYKSTDGTESWKPVKMPEGTNAPNDLAFDPENPERLYLACWPEIKDTLEKKGGLYLSEDGGESWQNIFNPASYVYGVTVHPEQPSTIFITTFEGSLYRSDDKGQSWRRLGGFNFKWAHRAIPDPYNKDMLYVTTFGSSVWYGPADGTDVEYEDIIP